MGFVGGVFLPGVAEGGEAELEGTHGELVAAGGEGVLEDVIFVLAEVFDDALLGVFKRLVIDAVFPFLEHDDLAQDAEAGVHATFVGEVLKELLVGGGAGFTPLEDVVAHLVGEVDEIHLAEAEALLGDGVVVLIIVVARKRGDGDLGALEDELIGGADVFVEAAVWEVNEVEEFAGVELAPGRHRETILAKHGAEALHSVENLLAGGDGFFRSALRIGVDFAETADGEVELVLITEAVEGVDHFWLDGIVGVDKGDPFAGGNLEAGIARGGEALIRLMDDFDAVIFLSEDVTERSAHIGRAVVDEDDLEIRVDLPADRLDATLEDFRNVVNRDDDRDNW